MNLTYGQLIRGNRHFRNLLWGQVVSELGNWFNFIAGLGLVRLVSDASPMAAGILLFWRTVPFAVLMPFAGTLADRMSRRALMIWTDIARAGFALIFLFVSRPEDLWIAYGGSILISTASAFFEGAKNAATPNITGRDGLLSGTALMFSSRFLLMAIGAALGGVAAVYFGYRAAFIINSVSFLVSAFSIWLIPEDAMREKETAGRVKAPFMQELKEGFYYTMTNPFALTILVMNIIWATGGGATNLVFEGLSVMVFSTAEMNFDFIYAAFLTANGIGLSVGMLIAHRVEAVVERRKMTRGFIGWSLIIHGILFAAAGFNAESVAGVFADHFVESVDRRGIRRAGDDVSAFSARLHSRAHLDARPRRGNYRLRAVELHRGRFALLHFGTASDGNRRSAGRNFGHRLVSARTRKEMI